MPIRIVPATLRDLSHIAANLRPEDRAEIDCQLDHWSPALLALTALQGFADVAELDGNSEAGFGAAEQRGGLGSPGGTRRITRRSSNKNPCGSPCRRGTCRSRNPGLPFSSRRERSR